MRKTLKVLLAVTAIAMLVAGVCFRDLLFYNNLHAVIEGQVYRSGQMDPDDLAAAVNEHKIRTIINLRGSSDKPWYTAEHETGKRLGVEILDVGIKANSPPLPKRLVQLCEILADRSKRPILMHCLSGSNRAGLASALATIANGDGLEAARDQLALRFGHVPLLKGRALDKLLEEYASWVEGSEPSADSLLLWARTVYTYKIYRATIRLEGAPTRIHLGEKLRLTFYAKNLSKKPWTCTPEWKKNQVGPFITLIPVGKTVAEGFRLWPLSFPEQVVRPGQTLRVDCAIQLKARKGKPLLPGEYILHADMYHYKRAKFSTIAGRPARQKITLLPRKPDRQ